MVTLPGWSIRKVNGSRGATTAVEVPPPIADVRLLPGWHGLTRHCNGYGFEVV
jgi:hypothetical protein